MPARTPKKTAAKSRKPKLVEPQNLDRFYIAAGGDFLEATLLDASAASASVERVHVKLLEEEAYQTFFEYLDRSAYDFADFICAKPAGWSRRYHPLSAQLIKARGVELNFTSAQQWADTSIAVMEGTMGMMEKRPELKAAMEAQVQAASPSSNGATSSPPSSASSSTAQPGR